MHPIFQNGEEKFSKSFFDLRGGRLLTKEWGGDHEGEVDIPMHTMLYVYVYFLNNFFLFFINKNLFFSFSFLLCDEISNNRKRILTNQKPE